MIKICGMWKSKSKDGKTYFSGSVGGVKYLLFQNNKTEENHPDVELFIKGREFGQQSSEEPSEEDLFNQED